MSGLGQGATVSDWDCGCFDFLHFVHEGHFIDDTPFSLFSFYYFFSLYILYCTLSVSAVGSASGFLKACGFYLPETFIAVRLFK
jgi:hypothetical protein